VSAHYSKHNTPAQDSKKVKRDLIRSTIGQMSGERDRLILTQVVIIKERVLELYGIRLNVCIKQSIYLTALPAIDFILLLVGRENLRPVTITDFTIYADNLCTQYLSHKDAITRLRQIVADFAVIMTDSVAPVQYHTAIRLRDPNDVSTLLWTLETVLS
jgi:hypothetical protein